MRYDYRCTRCRKRFERECPVAFRDRQFCDCNYAANRIFTPAQVMIPERFGISMASFAPTYEECAEVDRRNDEWLNRKKEPEKASFEDCLEKACVENRVDPRQLNEYSLREAVGEKD
jgi:hypothetical protein